MPKRVLVTGGAGFIGSHIVDALVAAGHEPFVIDSLESGRRENLPPRVPLFELDVRDAGALGEVFDEVRPQLVCHQAAQMSVSRSVRDPVFDADVNVLGLLNVFDHAARVGVERIVFASSGGVLYGDVTEPAGEDHPADPISPYGISKWAGERYLQFYAREHGLAGAALRYSNVYGPRQNPHGEAGVVAIFCTKMLARQPATINGDGRYVRDYVYVADVARINLLALTAELPEAFVALNVGTGQPTDVNELAAEIHRLARDRLTRAGEPADAPQPTHGPPRAGDLRSNLLSARKAGEVLGWTPRVTLADGLRETVEWFADQAGILGE
ncbi:MAG TPA: NAD-dependent epimerase/dehydratase family protein [Planctomycetaceae bacterium]|nr:NAD-dependent epimerase/dehydratase family protein [Planctomycetaceae bacterium]